MMLIRLGKGRQSPGKEAYYSGMLDERSHSASHHHPFGYAANLNGLGRNGRAGQ